MSNQAKSSNGVGIGKYLRVAPGEMEVKEIEYLLLAAKEVCYQIEQIPSKIGTEGYTQLEIAILVMALNRIQVCNNKANELLPVELREMIQRTKVYKKLEEVERKVEK